MNNGNNRIIEVDNLTRRFNGFVAVDDVSLEVKQGEIFGFVGPNGAGKSTTINMLCTLLKPTTGTATINGFDVRHQQAGVRESIGLIFQDPTLDTRLSAWQNLQFDAMLYNVPPDVFRERAERLMGMVELKDRLHSPVSSFSGGMKRRLEIALGLLHSPKVLFLDEPTIGLDPQTRRRIWEYLSRVRETEGLTIFLTTHYMDETEMCDRIAIIDKGKIIACGTPAELKAAAREDWVFLRTSDDTKALSELRGMGFAAEVSKDGVRVTTNRGDEFIPTMVRKLDSMPGPIRVVGAELRRPTMDDVFLHLTGRDIRDEEAGSLDEMRARMHRHKGGTR
ncbi:MAG TPA: ATP-binding cassette domain-containing protein [Bacteroidota bacterium]|nr:ATP-binding cassette domain-containing protein [Bacteroidota bacterium]